MELLGVICRWHHREHMPIREIERRTGLSRNTIRKYLQSNTVELRFKVPERPSRLDPYADKLAEWLRVEAGKSRKAMNESGLARLAHASAVLRPGAERLPSGPDDLGQCGRRIERRRRCVESRPSSGKRTPACSTTRRPDGPRRARSLAGRPAGRRGGSPSRRRGSSAAFSCPCSGRPCDARYRPRASADASAAPDESGPFPRYCDRMLSTATLAGTAALVGDPARASMLALLTDGCALTAKELATGAGITAQTASGHLARLTGAGLLAMERQ